MDFASWLKAQNEQSTQPTVTKPGFFDAPIFSSIWGGVKNAFTNPTATTTKVTNAVGNFVLNRKYTQNVLDKGVATATKDAIVGGTNAFGKWLYNTPTFQEMLDRQGKAEQTFAPGDNIDAIIAPPTKAAWKYVGAPLLGGVQSIGRTIQEGIVPGSSNIPEWEKKFLGYEAKPIQETWMKLGTDIADQAGSGTLERSFLGGLGLVGGLAIESPIGLPVKKNIAKNLAKRFITERADRGVIEAELKALGLNDDAVREIADSIEATIGANMGQGTKVNEITNVIEFVSKQRSAVPAGPAQSVVQVVKGNGEQVFYTVSPRDLKILSEDLIDGTTRGVAGKKINGDIYHLTAKTPTQMIENAGFKNGGEKTLADIIEMIQPKGKRVPIRDANGKFRGSFIDTPAYAKVAGDIAEERTLIEQAKGFKSEEAFIHSQDVSYPEWIKMNPEAKKLATTFTEKAQTITDPIAKKKFLSESKLKFDSQFSNQFAKLKRYTPEQLSDIWTKAHTPGYKADIGQNMGRTLSFTQARKVLENILKRNIDLEVVLGKDMINEGASAEVLGRTVRVLADSKNVEEFVVKHEGWHLFKRFLKQEKIEELNALELKFMKENPDITARVKERYPDASKRELAEEVFADEFAKWYTTGRGATLSNGAKLSVAVRNAFEKFAQFVTRLFTNKKAILNEYETEFEGIVKTLREDYADTNKYTEALKDRPTAQAMRKEPPEKRPRTDAEPEGVPTQKENADNQLRAQEASVGKQLAPTLREGEPSQLTQQVSSLTNDIPSITEIVNLDKLDISDDAKRFIEASVEDVRPMVEAKVGKTLTNKEVRKYAETNSRIIERTLGREQTQAWEAAMFNTREKLARLAERGVVDQEYIDTLLTVKSLGADLGRKLQSLSMTAQPSEAKAMDAILEEVLKVTDNADEVLKAAEGVDFKNYDEAVKFYRKFVKPKMGDWIDLVRYNSMLSSPLTHIVNTFSNIVNSLLVGTLEKATVGSFDAIKGVFTGERKRFAGEAVAFVDGYARNLGEATDRFVQALKGKNAITNLDTQSIPLTTKPGVAKVAEKVLSIPMRFLEASDQFFTALTEAGEMASLTYRQNRGIPVRTPIVKAQQAARYRLFRQELFPEGQGPVLDAVDKLTGVIYDMRHSKNPILSTIFKWTVPFVRTPMNIFKQGLEYSPIGLTTIPGAKDKELQLAKAAIGSTVFGVSALLLASDRITFAEPSNEKERTLWRDAGKQPYSIKMGDTWVSYQKLPPTLAFPISIVAALDQAQKERKVEDSTVEMILGAIAKYGNFLADQSYAKSIGDLLGAVKGGESEWAKLAGNYPQQVLPFRALSGWLAKLIDNVQRKPDPEGTFIDKQVDLLLMNIPGFSDKAPARTNQFGDPITNEQNIINAFSPVRVSEEKPEGMARLTKYLEEKLESAKEKEARDKFKTDVFLPIQEMSATEAKRRLDAMTDEEYEMYKSVRTSWRSTNMLTVRDFLNYDPREAVQFIRELPDDEADRILNLLTDEEYALYQTGKPE